MRYAVIAAVGLLGLAAPVWAEAWDFILTNNTGKEIKTIEVSVSGTNEWKPNVVDDMSKPKALKPAGRTTIHFDKAASQCRYQIKATFSDDTIAVFPAVNICDNTAITIRYANGTPTASAG